MENIKEFLAGIEEKLLATDTLKLYTYTRTGPYSGTVVPDEEYIPTQKSVEDFLFETRCIFQQVTADGDKNLQCTTGRCRSFSDIFLICKSYYPETSFLDICYILEKLDRSGRIYYFRCPDIGKRVVYTEKFSNSYTNKETDEFGITQEMLTEIYNNYETIKSS